MKKDINVKLYMMPYRAIFSLVVITIFNVGCSSDSDDVSSLPPPEPVIYEGKMEMATITIDNAGYILSKLFNSISAGRLTGREKLLATELEELPIFSTEFLSSVINVSTGGNTVNLCDSGRYTIENISGSNYSIVDMRCEIALLQTYSYSRIRRFSSPNITVMINSNQANHVEATMSFDYLSYSQDYIPPYATEENIRLALTGSISYSNTVLNNTREIYTGLNLTGQYDIQLPEYERGAMIKFTNFGIIESIDDVNTPDLGGSLYFSGSPATFHHSYYGGVTIETISPLRFSGLHNSTDNTYPDESGEILISGDNSSMRFVVMSGRHFKLEIDSDGDNNPDAIRYILYKDFREDYVWDYKCYNRNYGSPVFTCDYQSLSDYDGDGMHNVWEVSYETNPGISDGSHDLDNDGLSNIEEYIQGYYPNNEFSP